MKLLRTYSLALVLLGTLFLAAASNAAPAPGIPDGYSQVGLYMADGVYDLNEPHPELSGCVFGSCDGLYFQEVIMGRDPVERLEEEEAAKAFFWERFGIDAESAVASGRAQLRSVYADPRLQYRMVHLGGQKIHGRGWTVHDGAWLLTVTDPAGMDLGGEFAGTHAPAGTFMAFGNYRVDRSLPNGKPAGHIYFRFKSASPIFPSPTGQFSFRCELEHEEWGTGFAQGLAWSQFLPDGSFRFNARNVLTLQSADE